MDFGDNPPPADEDVGLETEPDAELDLHFTSPLLDAKPQAQGVPDTAISSASYPKLSSGHGEEAAAEAENGNVDDMLMFRGTPASSTTPFDTMSMASLGSMATEASTSSMAAEKRVSHLSKKNRELKASLNAEKARNKQLTKKVGDLEYNILKLERDVSRLRRKGPSTLGTSTDNNARSSSTSSSGATQGAKEQKPTEQEQKRMHDYRTEIATLKKELMQAHKALQKETGEDIPVSRILHGDSNWQGRAQQISLLKAKVNELQAQLKRSSSRSVSSLSNRSRPEGGVTDRGRLAIQKIEEKKRADIDELTTTLNGAEQKLKEMKEKYDAGKARSRMLSREVKELRQRADAEKQSAREAKGQVEELESRVQSLEDELQRAKLKPREKRTRHAAPDDALDADTMYAMQQLTKTCQEQAQTIASLKEQLAQRPSRSRASARAASSARSQRPSSMMEHVQASRSKSAGHSNSADEGHVRALEVERDKYKELCSILTQQLDEKREREGVRPLEESVHDLPHSALLQLVQDKHEECVALQRRHEAAALEHRQQMGVMANMVDKMKHIFSAAVKKVSSDPAS